MGWTPAAATYSLTTKGYDGRVLVLSCIQTQNIAKNTSTINWTLTSKGGNSNNYSTGATTVTINGTQVYYKERVSYTSGAFPAAKGSVSGTLTVAHNTGGTKTVSVSVSTAIFHTDIQTVSGTWTLVANPRAATLSSATDFTNESKPTIKYSNPAGNSVDKLEVYIFAADDKTILVGAKNISKTGTSAELDITAAEYETLLQAAKNSNSIKVRFKLRTTIGSYVAWGTTIEKTFSVVNSDPEVLTFTYHDINSQVTNLVDVENTFIRGYSRIRYEITAEAKNYAEIATIGVTQGNSQVNGATGIIENVYWDNIVAGVTDSRGNYTGLMEAITVIPYVELTCYQEDIQVELVGETGAEITLTVAGDYYSGSFGSRDNTLDLMYRYREKDGEWTSWKWTPSYPNISTDNSYSLTFTIPGLDYSKAYEIQSKAYDELHLNGVESSIYTSKLTPVFDWSETDFKFNVPVEAPSIAADLLTVAGDTFADYVIETGIEEMGSNGYWYWSKWKSGKAECYGCRNYGNMGVSTAWGSFYRSEYFKQTYPSGLFAAPPDSCTITVNSAGAGGWVLQGEGGRSGYDTAEFCVVRPVTGTVQQVYLGFNIVGRWKD